SSLSDDTVTALLEDDAGNLWVGTANGLNRRHRHTETFRRFQNDPSDPQSLGGQSVSSLCEGRSGELWIGTDSGLDRLDVETGGFSHFVHDPTDLRTLSDDQVLAIQQDADGRLWIATPSGLDRLDPGSGLVERYRHDPGDARSLSRGRVTALWIDRQGTLWIGSENGLAVFDRDRGTFDRHLHDLADPWSLSNSYVISLFEDRTGVLWIGTFDGVSRYAPGRDGFVTYRRQTGRVPTLSGADVWAVMEDRTGTLWIAYGAFGLDRFDREAGTIVHYAHDPADPESLPAGPTATVYEDRGGVIWVGSFGGGLSRLEGPPTTPGDGRDRQRFLHFRHDPADPGTLSSNEVQRLYEDSAGRFWVATPRGLNVLDRRTGRAVRCPLRPQDPPTLATARISSIVEDRQGTLWIGSFTEGLYRLGSPSAAGDRRFRRFVHDPDDAGSLRSDEVIALHVDRTGCLWIGTASGLDRRRPGRATFDHVQKQDGLPGSMIRGILEDDAGFLWISTNRGLSRLDPRNGTARNYDVDDGLQSNSFSTKAEFKSPSGELFFGGWRGLNAFFPDRIVDDPLPPQVVLTDFRLFNRSMPPRDRDPDSPLERSILDTRELVLTHRDYVFGIEFAALHYAAPRKNRYSYRLEGLEPEWIETDASQRFVQYSNLAPGKYVFRVKASNKDGVWNADGVTIAITVRPPPWRTWWAYALYAAALAATVVGYTRRQRQKLRREQLEAERERRINARRYGRAGVRR
ncbi:MAG: histidine kinase, partial [bacterium]|nr:histidine kinase [bacterium]